MNGIGSIAVKGTLWSACDRFGTMALQFAVNLVLARLLTPDDFGAIGMLMIFIAVSQVFVDGGFGSALIQKKAPTQTDYSTIFLWNSAVGLVLYAILFVCAPFVAGFYKMPVLCRVLRVIGFTLVLSCMANIQANRLQKELRFKYLAITNIASFLAGGAVAIAMAVADYGVWSLVAMMMVQGVARILLFYWVSRWLPRLTFSKESFRQLFSFGGYLFLSNLLETVCKNLQGLIIGRRFSAAQMGYYTQASKLDNVTSYSIPQVVAVVMYPVFSQLQDDRERLRALVEMDLRVISIAVYPLLALLIMVAEPLIDLLYGEQWLPAAPYFRILCFGGFFLCLNNIPYYAVAACGKSRSLFLAGFYKWGMLGALLFASMNFGMNGIMWSLSASMANIFVTNVFLARKYVGSSFCGVLGALLPSTAMVALCGAAACLAGWALSLHWMTRALLFAALYAAVAVGAKPKAYTELLALAERLIRKR